MTEYDATHGRAARAARLDGSKLRLEIDGTAVALTPRECELMKLLLQREGRVVPRATLLRKIWGSVNSENSSILNVYIHALRRKIERDPLRPRHILTVRGRGLYFEA